MTYWLTLSAAALVVYLLGYLHGRHSGYWIGVNEKPELEPLTEEEKRHGYFEMTYREPGDSEHAPFVRPGDDEERSS